ncbi:unnamed protein product, partial [Amoebophrya sp. A25]|eukprot:GSA25T00027835001.1
MLRKVEPDTFPTERTPAPTAASWKDFALGLFHKVASLFWSSSPSADLSKETDNGRAVTEIRLHREPDAPQFSSLLQLHIDDFFRSNELAERVGDLDARCANLAKKGRQQLTYLETTQVQISAPSRTITKSAEKAAHMYCDCAPKEDELQFQAPSSPVSPPPRPPSPPAPRPPEGEPTPLETRDTSLLESIAATALGVLATVSNFIRRPSRTPCVYQVIAVTERDRNDGGRNDGALLVRTWFKQTTASPVSTRSLFCKKLQEDR